jgi:hypothetical protein
VFGLGPSADCSNKLATATLIAPAEVLAASGDGRSPDVIAR